MTNEPSLSPRQPRVADTTNLRAKFKVHKLSHYDTDARYGSAFGRGLVEVEGERIYDFFVLRPEKDEASRIAVLAYADACEADAPDLAADIRERWGES